MKDELIALAKEAGIVTAHNTEHLTIAGIERFAALVAAKEREECAIICDGYATNSSNPMNFAENCATTIRARKP